MKSKNNFTLAVVMFLLCSIFCFGEPIDSLYREVKSQARPSLSSINQLLLLLDADGITDSLIHYDHQTHKAEMMKDVHLNMAAYYYERATNMPATLQAARDAEEVGRQDSDTSFVSEALAYQAVAASRMGQLDIALEATREELLLDSLSGNLPNLSRAYNTLAGLSLQAGNIDDAKYYVLKAIDMERALEDSSHLSVRYGVAAEIYVKAGEHQRALYFAQRAYELDRQAGNEINTARRLSQMADIYSVLRDDAHAESFYQRSIQILQNAGEKKSLAINLKQLGQLYLRQGKSSEALQALEECERMCRAMGNRYTLQQACRLLAEAYEPINPKRSIGYLQESLALTDSLHSERSEQLAMQLRKSQGDLVQEQSTPLASSTSSWRTFVLLVIAAVLGVICGLWLRARRRNISQKADDAVSDDVVTAPITKPVPKEPTSLQSPIGLFNAETVLLGKKLRKEDIAFLTKVAEIYDHNLGLNRFSIDSIASEMCMSRSQFTRRIYAVTGMTANTYFNRIRLEKAQRLLKNSDRPINVIAMECGFDDTSYFNNLFKKYFKVTPMQYRIMPDISRLAD